MRSTVETQNQGMFDYCFVGSGAILNRLLTELSNQNARILIVSDQIFHSELTISQSENCTVITRRMLLDSFSKFEIENLIILTKTNLWSDPNDFKAILLKLQNRITSRVLLLSSGSIYGDTYLGAEESSKPEPNSAYANQKVFEENVVLEVFNGRAKILILRPSNVYGDVAFDDFINQCIYAVRHGSSLPLYANGSLVRDYLFVDCLVRGIQELLQLEIEEVLTILNIGTGVPTYLLEVIKIIEGLTKVKIELMDLQPSRDIVQSSVLQTSALSATIPWQPVGIEKGLRLYLERSYPELINEQ